MMKFDKSCSVWLFEWMTKLFIPAERAQLNYQVPEKQDKLAADRLGHVVVKESKQIQCSIIKNQARPSRYNFVNGDYLITTVVGS